MADFLTCLCAFDYEAQGNEELSFSKDEHLICDETNRAVLESKNWWKMRNERGEEGFVPSNYLQIIDNAECNWHSMARGGGGGGGGGGVEAARGGVGRGNGHSEGLSTVCAKFPYQAQRGDELALVKDDVVVVLEKEDDGWWRGRLASGAEGWFPSNYVTEIASTSSNVGGGRGRLGLSPGKLSASAGPGPLCRVRTKFAYTSAQAEELSFKEGEILDVLSRDEPEWWMSRNKRGDTGLVPANYVEEMPADNSSNGSGNQRPAGWGRAGASKFARGGGGAGGGGGLENEPWFHGPLPRQSAEEMLSKTLPGTFLVRASESTPGNYAVSLCTTERIRHFIVQSLSPDDFKIGSRSFSSLAAMVDWYRKNPIFTMEDGGKVYLQRPLAR